MTTICECYAKVKALALLLCNFMHNLHITSVGLCLSLFSQQLFSSLRPCCKWYHTGVNACWWCRMTKRTLEILFAGYPKHWLTMVASFSKCMYRMQQIERINYCYCIGWIDNTDIKVSIMCSYYNESSLFHSLVWVHHNIMATQYSEAPVLDVYCLCVDNP